MDRHQIERDLEKASGRSVDRHKIWRQIERDLEEVRGRTPEGYEPVVQVYLAGRPEPITLGFVQTRRDPDNTWISFQSSASNPPAGSKELPADCYWVHVPEGCILGIEINLQPTGRAPIGFTHSDRDE